MKTKIFIALIGLAGVLSSCSDSNSPSASKNTCFSGYEAPNIKALHADLNSAKQRWANAKIENYSYTRELVAYIGSTATITVQDGKVISTVGHGSLGSTPTGYTMDELFASAEKTISSLGACQTVKATYDAKDGHVVTFSYDNYNKSGPTDTQYHYTVTDFQVK